MAWITPLLKLKLRMSSWDKLKVKLVGGIGKYAPFAKNTFAFLEGKVLLLLPDQDIKAFLPGCYD